MYQIKLSNRAKKELKKLALNYKSKVTRIIDLLSENPFLGEKMSGEFKGWYSIKIPPIRIIYTTDFQNKIIIIRAIGHRGDIYKN
ncbi:type II toxin-antitoxin system RelE/ParE family toxin [Candidatus Microgenomates bacterium]|nr:type II toxin-antitoxin system RelE/ParE family toxin [Candidatus Microgenomates bacterium]